jgi:hypothetical protein
MGSTLKKYQKSLQMKSMKGALDNMISSVRNVRKKDERDHECEVDTEASSSDEDDGGIEKREWSPTDGFDALAFMAAENPNKKRDSLDKVKDSLKTVKSGMKKGFKKAAVKMQKRSQSEGAFPTQHSRSKSEGGFSTEIPM